MYRDARNPALAAGQTEVSAGFSTSHAALDFAAPSLHLRSLRLNTSRVEIDEGHTFDNRFLLVWHDREGCFKDAAYRRFWQAFSKAVCNDGPRVDDTLHVSPLGSARRAEFLVIGGDGRLASHCANGLMYAGWRYAERCESRAVTFYCGRDRRTVRVRGAFAEVNLGRPRPLSARGRYPAQLRRAPLLVDTGEPHAVSFDQDVALWDHDAKTFSELGQAVCRTGAPAGINWNLVTPCDDGLAIRTFERGVRRPTSSCGTGSAAAFHAAQLSGRYDCDELPVVSAGGCHLVRRHKDDLLVTGQPSHHRTWVLDDYLSTAL
jgi:diaminopimelate epimerase